MKKPRKTKLSSHERILAVRIPDTLSSGLDRYVDRLRKETPWAQMTRSDAVRWILIAALKASDAEAATIDAPMAMPAPSEPPVSGEVPKTEIG